MTEDNILYTREDGIAVITYGSLEWPLSVFGKEKTSRFQSTSDSEDAAEGVESFLQKRPPVWKGR